MEKEPMETRKLVEKVNMLKIFWESQIEFTMELKPTTMLDEKDVISLKDMTSSSGQSVGIQSMDAQEIWTSWTTQYKGLMELRLKEVDGPLSNLLDEIHGITTPLEKDRNDEPSTLQSDSGASGLES